MAIYMKFGNVKGQVSTDGYKEWIELHSMQYGVGRSIHTSAGGQGREAAHPSISEIVVTKDMDVASPGLYQDSLAGAFDTKVEIKLTTTTKNKVDTFLALELTGCGVSGYSVSSGGDKPTESLSLNFTKIMFTPSPLDEKGTPKKGAVVTYDLLKMKAS